MEAHTNSYCLELARKLHFKTLEECSHFPKYFTIETCNNCNARCIMCPKGQKGTKSLQLMEDSVFERIAEELQEYSSWVEMVCLNSDGEPLLDKKIAERIRKLKDIGMKHVNISTNAQLLTKERAQELLEAGLDDIRISLDGFTKETFEKVRKGLNYDMVKENVLNLIEMRNCMDSEMEIRIRMVELEENKAEREDWLAYWKSKVKDTDKVQLMPMHTWSGKIAEEEQERIIFYADEPSISVFSSFTINYDGTVQLCDSDIEQQVVLGNIINASVREIWQGEKFELIRRQHANGKRNQIAICQGCDHWSREFKENISKGGLL